MAKTPEQIIELNRQHVERSKMGFQSAKERSHADGIAMNLGQVLKASLMEGMIGWRCGNDSPVNPFREGLGFIRQGYSTWLTLNGSSAARTLHLPLEKAFFVGYLVNESALAFDLNDLVADRLLDAILGRGLQDQWDEQVWTAGLDQLQKLKGSALAIETYTTYQRLLRAPRGDDVNAVVEKAILLFDKRKSNSFYSGGEQTDGGGPDNAITVDYRLAAIMKKIGYKSDSIHSWKWG